jgi:restriction system protein
MDDIYPCARLRAAGLIQSMYIQQAEIGNYFMPMPPFQEFMRPILKCLEDGAPRKSRDITEAMAVQFALTPAERNALLPGGSLVIRNRVGWAITDLGKARLIERVSHGLWRVTADGKAALGKYPTAIGLAELGTYSAFMQWKSGFASVLATTTDEPPSAHSGPTQGEADETPDEAMERIDRELRQEIEDELLARLHEMPPARFEWLVEELVIKLGYGASASEVKAALRRGSGDQGVDGVISEDRLGLGQIYLQAKRWQSKVSRPEIQAFVGAMLGRAQKGVFITTSEYTKEALEYAKAVQGLRIRLVDGRELASLMVDVGLGVSEGRTYRTYRIDNDFFEEGE